MQQRKTDPHFLCRRRWSAAAGFGQRTCEHRGERCHPQGPLSTAAEAAVGDGGGNAEPLADASPPHCHLTVTSIAETSGKNATGRRALGVPTLGGVFLLFLAPHLQARKLST
ncbi:hypothetical protein Cni_G14507 [Canna indica]|uniref:Uncharacterized protein n=1 Tax=Canna indica TaxID=4628 RepID=A0AAQ3QDR4_9LILI|nr:hypothetical protein Cni_G14507 [Canna indica]